VFCPPGQLPLIAKLEMREFEIARQNVVSEISKTRVNFLMMRIEGRTKGNRFAVLEVILPSDDRYSEREREIFRQGTRNALVSLDKDFYVKISFCGLNLDV
jgi:hypothetical protein